MSVIIQGSQLREVSLGRRAAKTQALSAATLPIFTVAGGEVLVTSVYLRATVTIAAITGSLAMQQNPTTGLTSTIVAATDLGSVDTTAGSTIGVTAQDSTTPDFLVGGLALRDWVVTTGQIELVGTNAIDGTVEIVVTWVPLTDGATLVAA